MKKILFAFFLIAFLPAVNAAFPNVTNYLTYYGSSRINEITQFQLAFLESYNYNSLEISNIKNAGTIPLCYLTIGEDDELHIGDGLGPGGYASYYLDADNNNQPDQNPFWLSYYVNASNSAWQDRILNNLSETILNQKGCSGLFLDTIDTIEIYPDTIQGMLSLIQQLDSKYPGYYLVANRGFYIAWEIAPYIDGIMFEDFSSALANNQYHAWTGQDLDWTSSWGLVLREIREDYPLTVFALDYSNPTDQVLIDYDYNRALDFGFIPYVSTINLDDIFFHTYTRQPGIIPDGFTDIQGDVNKAEADIISTSVLSNSRSIMFSETLLGQSSNRAYYGVLIDTDFNVQTGYASNAIGADFLMEGSVLYSYNGDGVSWDWQQLDTVNFNTPNNKIKWSADYSSLSLGYGHPIAFVFYAGIGNEQDTTVRGKTNTFPRLTTTTSILPFTPITTTTLTSSTSSTSTSTTSTSSTSTSSISTTSTTSTIPSTFYLIPAAAYDNLGIDQVSPDDGSLDGTVDISNDDSRWLTNNLDYIQVNSWDVSIPSGTSILSLLSNCEVDFTNSKPGNIIFSYNLGSGWQQACSYPALSQTLHTCSLPITNSDDMDNMLFRCSLESSSKGSIGFSLDSIYLQVNSQ